MEVINGAQPMTELCLYGDGRLYCKFVGLCKGHDLGQHGSRLL